MTTYELLEQRFRQVYRLKDLSAIAAWDEAVMMPEGSGRFRNEAIAELGVVTQNLLTAPEVGQWISAIDLNHLTEWQKANFREMRRIHLENTAVPAELNQRITLARMACEQQWRRLRAENDWKSFMPYLHEVLKLSREAIDILARAQGLSLYDAALTQFSPGLNTTAVNDLFTQIKSFLPDLIQSVVDRQARERVILPEGKFPMTAQKALGIELMKAVGFSTEIGRLDESHHPFCGGTSRDVRITTRYNEHEFVSSMMGVLHETGHAIYEQHLPEAWLNQPVGQAAGMSIHESQSLLMEMQICRSREFLEFAAPHIRHHLGPFVRNPESLDAANLAKLLTRVKPGLIRVDADEVTYPAHVILRFEIERDLLEDRWPLSELPAVWNDRMHAYLGLNTLGDDRNGCMQDVHWPSGAFGYFPAYTFGAVIAAQLFASIEQHHPGVRAEVAHGNLGRIHSWLDEKVWGQGARLGTMDLVQQVSGPLSAQAFKAHLQDRYLS